MAVLLTALALAAVFAARALAARVVDAGECDCCDEPPEGYVTGCGCIPAGTDLRCRFRVFYASGPCPYDYTWDMPFDPAVSGGSTLGFSSTEDNCDPDYPAVTRPCAVVGFNYQCVDGRPTVQVTWDFYNRVPAVPSGCVRGVYSFASARFHVDAAGPPPPEVFVWPASVECLYDPATGEWYSRYVLAPANGYDDSTFEFEIYTP